MRAISARATAALREFLSLESAGGILLVAAAALGLAAANSPLAGLYERLLALPLTVRLGTLGVDKPLLLWINDGLMAVFFLLVALELKREVLEGQFSERRQIALPAACALGGMAVPMAVYALVTGGDPALRAGTAIPAATDIAFALGVLALLGARVPIGLKLLLTAVAVLDDLGAIVLVALFYTEQLAGGALLAALAAVAGLVALNRRGVVSVVPYALLGVLLWVAVLKSGVHATLAGVVLGWTVPMRDPRDPDRSPVERLEHDLHPTVAYAILPLFAFANAGVPLEGFGLARLASPVPLGIGLGLALGKPAGVLLGALVATRGRRAGLPEGVDWPALAGMAILCGIGFTMSLFLGSLAFETGEAGGAPFLVASRIGVLAGSLAAALAGTAVLAAVLPLQPDGGGARAG
jgi:NhaA family Na+:H+ antiporter